MNNFYSIRYGNLQVLRSRSSCSFHIHVVGLRVGVGYRKRAMDFAYMFNDFLSSQANLDERDDGEEDFSSTT